jgi:hypothetical protein
MTDYRERAYAEIDACLRRNEESRRIRHEAVVQAGRTTAADEDAVLRMLRAERLEIIDRLITLAGPGPDPGPPDPGPPDPDEVVLG